MYTITLIGTRHEELGKCNSNELYQIIAQIDPEVVFEEIPPSYFDAYYVKKSRRNLETDTINTYLETHRLEHIPVDSDDLPPDSFFRNLKHMLGRIEGLADVNGFDYRSFIDATKKHTYRYGFQFLNSPKCVWLNDAIYDTIEKGLHKLNDVALFQTYNLWRAMNEKRENEMLRNIYKFSKDRSYDRAIFTVGAAHRKSILRKIQEYETKGKIKLNWTFYNN